MTESKQEYQIYIDTREATQSGAKGGMSIYKELQKFKDLTIHKENLGQAIDYIVPGLNGVRHAIQRKTCTEMLHHEGVLNDCIGMRQLEGAESYLLIEGPLSMIEKFSHMPNYVVIGLVDSILMDYDIKIIPSPNKEWTARWLYQRAKKLGKVKKPDRILSVGEANSPELPLSEQARRVLETFPDMGPKRATALLNHYGTLKYTLDAVDDWASNVEGIGKKTSESVNKVMRVSYKLIETDQKEAIV